MMRRLWIVLVSVVLLGGTLLAQAPQGGGPQGSATEGFVPLSSLPPGEEMPAAPFVIGAYAFFLLLMMFYLWTIWRRLNKVEQELQEFERRHGGAAR
jgi:type VI protein secretion system component VasF